VRRNTLASPHGQVPIAVASKHFVRAVGCCLADQEVHAQIEERQFGDHDDDLLEGPNPVDHRAEGRQCLR